MAVRNYKGLKAVRKSFTVTEENVDNILTQIQAENPLLKQVLRAAKMGDTVDLDFAGFVGGVQFEGGTGNNYQLELGSGTFIPGFEDQLVGVFAGESKDVRVTFPQQYTPDLAGKDAVFKCKVNKVLEKAERPVDDAFAKEFFGSENLDAAKTLVRATLEEQAADESREDIFEQVMDQICAANPRSFTEAEVSEDLDKLVREFVRMQTGQDIPAEDFCSMAGLTLNQLIDELRPSSLKRMQIRALLREIAAQEGLEAAEDDVKTKVRMMAAQFGMTPEQFSGMIDPSELIPDIILEKAMSFLVENAEITE